MTQIAQYHLLIHKKGPVITTQVGRLQELKLKAAANYQLRNNFDQKTMV